MVKSSSPLISIGMPVFNCENFVGEAIHSLLRQTEKNFELIISDNCSTDGTLKICKRFAEEDARIKLVLQDKNHGALVNFTEVLKMSSGKYFLWAAGDDIWSENWLKVLLAAHDDGVSVSFGSVENISESGKKIKKYIPQSFMKGSLRSQVKFYLEEDTNGKANLIYGMFQRKQLLNIGLDTLGSVSYGDDMIFVFNCLQNGDLVTSETAILYKRVPNYERPILTKGFIIKRLFLLNRIQNYYAYVKISKTLKAKLIIISLLPIKYIGAFWVNIKLIVKRHLLKKF